jgi:NAD(P)-dependent dehydrogenase (short-subunit alcohol dehydrogenase family)
LGNAGATAFCEADVSRGADMKALVQAAVDRFGGLDIFVNNAGITHRRQPLLEVDEATFDRIFAVNVKSIYLSAIHAVPALRARGGGVMLNIASTAGVRPRPGLTWYNGSKGAVITLTKSMAVELAPDRIRVCGVNPVLGESGMTALYGRGGHAGEPEEIRGDDSPRPLQHAAGCRERRALSRLRRGGYADRRVSRGRRRPLHLKAQMQTARAEARAVRNDPACRGYSRLPKIESIQTNIVTKLP